MNNGKLIEQKMEELAELIRASRATPVKIDFSIVVKEKTKRLERFGAALKDMKMGEAHRLLTDAGYERSFHNEKEGKATYFTKSKPGYLVKIERGAFSVQKGTEIKQAEMPLSFMGAYLEKK